MSLKQLTFVVLMSIASSAAADFRCPNSGKIVELGMSMYEVKIACGEPSFRAIAGNIISGTAANVGSLGAEQWTYDFGSRSFISYFNFDGGTLRSINQSDQHGTTTDAVTLPSRTKKPAQ